MLNAAAVILAGGEGRRMKSSKPKVLHEVLFKPMIDWVADAALEAGVDNICVVTGFAHEKLEEHLGGRFAVALQKEQLGTAHAVLQAAPFLEKNGPEDVMVLCGDAPLISAATIRESYRKHKDEANSLTVITAEVADPAGYGRILHGADGAVLSIVEEKDASAEEKRIREVNSGAYWFQTRVLAEVLGKIENHNAQGEYYLTDAVSAVSSAGHRCGAFLLADETEMAGANDRLQLERLNRIAKEHILRALCREGVTVTDLSGVMVGPDVRIGRDTVLLPGTILRGRTVIGENCVIGPNSLIENSELADNVQFNASQAYASRIGEGVTVGPFTQLRPGSVLCEKVHVGDFVEIKNSIIGEGTKVAHLTYVGDSDIGKHVNFGCGCVTVNYDGVKKYRTKVGDNAFIGCNTNLVAPVSVGDNAYTAAGSTITKNVPENALAVARSRQENLEGWVLRKRPKKN